MKRRTPLLSLPEILLFGGLGLLTALGFSLFLAHLARPENLSGREAMLQAELKSLQRKDPTGYGLAPMPKGDICEGDIAKATEVLRKRLTLAGSLGGASVQSIFVAAEAPLPNAPDFTPLAFELETKGSYEASIGILGELSRSQPLIFTEKAKLTSELTDVRLNLKGEVLCWIGA